MPPRKAQRRQGESQALFVAPEAERTPGRPRPLAAATAAGLAGASALAPAAAAGLHLATGRGAIGTGSGRGGALVALTLGGVGLFLGRRALVRSSRTGSAKQSRPEGRSRAMPNASVRYVIEDVPAAIAFYTTVLGFSLEIDVSPAFAAVSRAGVRLLLSGEGSSGRRPLADGRSQEPGGWNRLRLEVADLASEVERLRAAQVPFRTHEIVTGPGGSQVIIDDPSGNPIELFQPRA